MTTEDVIKIGTQIKNCMQAFNDELINLNYIKQIARLQKYLYRRGYYLVWIITNNKFVYFRITDSNGDIIYDSEV